MHEQYVGNGKDTVKHYFHPPCGKRAQKTTFSGDSFYAKWKNLLLAFSVEKRLSLNLHRVDGPTVLVAENFQHREDLVLLAKEAQGFEGVDQQFREQEQTADNLVDAAEVCIEKVYEFYQAQRIDQQLHQRRVDVVGKSFLCASLICAITPETRQLEGEEYNAKQFHF